LPLAFLNSNSLKRDMGIGLLSCGRGLFCPPTTCHAPSMALKFGVDLGPLVGTTAPGVETTDLSCGRETWEERCSGAPGPAIAINTSLNEAGVVTLACISDSSMAPLGMGPTRGGGRLEEGRVGEEGPAMGRARSAAVAEGATTAGARGAAPGCIWFCHCFLLVSQQRTWRVMQRPIRPCDPPQSKILVTHKNQDNKSHCSFLYLMAASPSVLPQL
jgi:hypothetical protein